jgi:hypothetical protein
VIVCVIVCDACDDSGLVVVPSEPEWPGDLMGSKKFVTCPNCLGIPIEPHDHAALEDRSIPRVGLVSACPSW